MSLLEHAIYKSHSDTPYARLLFHTYFWYLRGDWQLIQVDGFDTFVDSISLPTTHQGADTFLIWICDT